MVASNTENASDLLSEGHHSKTDQYTLRTDTLLRKPSSVDTTQESQSFRTPAWDRESPPTVTYPPGLLKLAVPRSAISSPRDFNPNLYTEASNTPKRFRPEEYEKESPGDDELTDSTMSSSRAWLPPEPPDEVPEGEETPISPTEVRDFHLCDITQLTYLAVVLAVGQRIYWSRTSTWPAFKHHHLWVSWGSFHTT